MLLTAFPPAPPTPHTMMRGFSSLNSGALKLIVISWPLVCRWALRPFLMPHFVVR